MSWWTFTVLGLACYRLTRLAGWDDLPPVVRARAWLLGEHEKVTPAGPETNYRRPFLADLFGCAFCLGWWISLVVYVCWLLEPSWTMYAAVPLALGAVVGLVAKNFDP